MQNLTRNPTSATSRDSKSPRGDRKMGHWLGTQKVYMRDFLGEPLLVIAVTGCVALGVYLGIEHLKEYARERRLVREREALRRQFWGYE